MATLTNKEAGMVQPEGPGKPTRSVNIREIDNGYIVDLYSSASPRTITLSFPTLRKLVSAIVAFLKADIGE